jgi:1-acyl-sn-glycerol-3-phosphate acyltransferase
MRVLEGLLTVLQWLGAAAWSVIWISLAMVVTMVTFSGEVALVMARRIWSPGILRLARVRLQVEPLPEVDWRRPHIFVMNHQSSLDIPAAFAVLPANLRFIAKHTLSYVPFLGWYMWMTGMIFVNRSDRAKAVSSLRKAGERIRAGANILAFPEGTRSRDGRIHPFKKGAFVVALEAQVPIVPVVIDGSGSVLGGGRWKSTPGTFRIKVGQPISTARRRPEERDALIREVRQAMIQLHREIGGLGGDDQIVALPEKADREALDLAGT